MGLWDCLECGFENPATQQVCAFCEAQRGAGLLAWARSDAEWETRDGKSLLPPVEVEQTLRTELEAQKARLNCRPQKTEALLIPSIAVNRFTATTGLSLTEQVIALAETMRQQKDPIEVPNPDPSTNG